MADQRSIEVAVRKEVQNGFRTLAAAGETAVQKNIGVDEYRGAQPFTDPSDEAIYSIVKCRANTKETLYYVEETVADITALWAA
jgi:hypothetical protein